MEPTATPDDGREPAEAGPVPGQRRPGEDPRAAPGDNTTGAGAPAGSALTNDTQMVPLGSRRPADALLGGTTNGLRWTNQGGFAPVEANGHRNPDFGARHGGTPRANGQNPVANGSLPGTRSPFAPPPAPETPPLYAPSPFATGAPQAPELGDPLSPLDPAPDAHLSPDEAGDHAGHQEGAPPAATGSAQVPMPLDRPVSAQPAGDARSRAVPASSPEHEAWAPPAHRGPASASASVPVSAGGDTAQPAGSPPFPGFDVPPAEPPAARSATGQPAGWVHQEQGEDPESEVPGSWGRQGALPPNPLQPTPAQAPLPPNPLQSALPPNPLQPAPVQPLQPGPVPGGRRRAEDEPDARAPGRRAGEDEQARSGGRRAAEPDDSPAEARTADQGGARAASLRDVREANRAAEDDTRVGRRAATGDDAPAGRRAARAEGGDAPLRPGDVRQESVTFWDEAASGQFRAEWHEVKAQFVDDPVAALTRAHALLTEAVQDLGEAMLAERDRLDPLRDTAVPDTESMRMAMRGYREFLDRILSL